MPQFLSSTRLSPDSPHFEIFYYGTFECIMGGFLYSRNEREAYHHPMRHFIRLCFRVYVPLKQRAEAEREKAMEAEFAELREEHTSKDAHMEDEADLSPAEKMRIFRNALNSMNKVGCIFYDNQHRTNEIRISASGLKGVQRLFELNPDATPDDLLKIMDGCMELHTSKPKPTQFKEKVQWHARMGWNLDTFVRYLRVIILQLGMSEVSGFTTFLGDERQEESLDKERELQAA